MTNKILEGMARAAWNFDMYDPNGPFSFDGSKKAGACRTRQINEMRAALLWLADNVSDEMADAATRRLYELPGDMLAPDARKQIIAAALRQAAGGGDE